MSSQFDYNSIDLNLITEVAKSAAEDAKKVLCHYFGNLSKVQEKHKAGLVSEADLESEKVIVDRLRKSFPDIPILGEEGAFKMEAKEQKKIEENEFCWVVDPLDGTTNYVYKFHVFCISIGLEHKGRSVAGVINAPLLNKVYSAYKGGGAYLNDIPIKVSQRKTLGEALVATGFSTADKEDLTEEIEIFSRIVRSVRGVRRAGAAAFDLCMVAEGVFDAFWEKKLKSWDTCAGAILVEEAGGQVTNYNGDPFLNQYNSILASNPYIFKDIKKLL